MKIYTREKKPKVYSILALSAVFVVAFGLMALFFKQAGRFALANISVILTLYFVIILVILIVSLKRQLEYNPYSYNTIYYFGFALFVLSLVISSGSAAYEAVRGVGNFAVSDAAHLILNSARAYMRLSAPFLAVFSLGLAVSNFFLIYREGKRFSNILGIILSAMLIAGEVVLFALDDKFAGNAALIIDVFCAVFLYFECMLIGAIFADVFAAMHIPEYNKDYLIILGCRVAGDSSPTPLLRARIDRAFEFALRQKEIAGKEIVYIASGGKGADEPTSEAECIKNHLVAKGVSEDRIIVEDKSTNTLENMRYSMEKVKYEGNFAFSTTNYHVFRSGIAANRARKFKAEGMGAETKWYFWPNASVREFIGLLTEHRGKQIFVLSGLVALYVAIALFA